MSLPVGDLGPEYDRLTIGPNDSTTSSKHDFGRGAEAIITLLRLQAEIAADLSNENTALRREIQTYRASNKVLSVELAEVLEENKTALDVVKAAIAWNANAKGLAERTDLNHALRVAVEKFQGAS